MRQQSIAETLRLLHMNDLTTFKDKIRRALLKDFWTPFELLLESVNKDSPHYNPLVLIGSRYGSLQPRLVEGTMAGSDYLVESTKIRKSLLDLLEQIKSEDLSRLEIEEQSLSLMVEKVETIRSISRDAIRERSVLWFPRFYEVFCLGLIIYLLSKMDMFALGALELAEDGYRIVGILIMLVLFGVIIFLYLVLRVVIKAQLEFFTASQRLKIQVVGVQESVLDILIRMNAALGCRIVEVDHDTAQLKSHYTGEMKIAKKKLYGLARPVDGFIIFHFSVSETQEDPMKKEIIIDTEYPLDNLPKWIPKDKARSWLMPVGGDEINTMVEQSLQLMEDYLFSEFGQSKE